MEAPLVRIEGVRRAFGETVAVDGLSLDVPKGELFCLLGGSGCGKSTLLRMLAGFERPDAGRILIDGKDMAGVPPHARDVNMMFQSYALFPHMSVAKNVGYGLARAGMGRKERAARVEEMLSLVQMGHLGGRKPDQLSGGQRQRVALARALARGPKLLLLDEPLGALDRKLREETQLELKSIQSRLGVTFIVVTHDQDEAMTLADRLAVMRAGRLEQVGPPREVYEHPRSRYVADFLGTVNLIEGRVAEVGTSEVTVARSDGGGYVSVSAFDASPGQEVALAVRPEKIALGGDYANHLTGELRDVVYHGGLSVFHVALPSGQRVRMSQTNRFREGMEVPARGARVTLSFPPEAAVVLTS